MEKLNIYSKLQKIQSEIKELIRTEENKFQKFFFIILTNHEYKVKNRIFIHIVLLSPAQYRGDQLTNCSPNDKSNQIKQIKETTTCVTTIMHVRQCRRERAARLMAKLRTASGLDLPLRHLFERPTVAALAEAIDALTWAATSQRAAARAANRVEIEL